MTFFAVSLCVIFFNFLRGFMEIVSKIFCTIFYALLKLFELTLVTQPMSQLRPNWSELRSMNYYHQIFCRFRKCKRKVPPLSPLSNDFEKCHLEFKNVNFEKKSLLKIALEKQLFSKSLLRSDGGGTFRLHFRNLQKIWW